MEPPDDTLELLQRWHDGDRRALDELLARDFDYIRTEVRRRLGQQLRREGETEDFVHDACVRVLEYGPRFVVGDGSQFRALVARIVANTLTDKHRRSHALKRAAGAPGTVLVVDPTVGTALRPSLIAARHEEEEWLLLGLELMDTEGRELIRRHHFDGVALEDIAEELKASAGAVRGRVQRAMRRLAKIVRKIQDGRLRELL